MRLAFEAAIGRADEATLIRWTPTLKETRADGVMAAATWTGPRDGQQRA